MNSNVPLAATLLLLALPLPTSSADPLEDLETFRQKLAAPQTKQPAATGDMQDLSFQIKELQKLIAGQSKQPEKTRDLQRLASQVAILQNLIAQPPRQRDDSRQREQLSSQIKMLQNLVAKEDYDRAQQIIKGFSSYGLPSEFMETWSELADPLGKEIEKRKAGRLTKWIADIDQLVKDTHDGCLAAKTSAGLEPLLLRCSAMQASMPHDNTVMGQRLTRKIAGVSETLTAWADFLDYYDQTAGDPKGAGFRLRKLNRGNEGLPVFSTQEIAKLFPSMEGETVRLKTRIAEILTAVKTPDDLPSALQQLEAFRVNPQVDNPNFDYNEVRRVRYLIDAWTAAREGKTSEALDKLGDSQSMGDADVTLLYADIDKQIRNQLLADKISAWTKLERNPGERDTAYLARVLDDLYARHEYTDLRDALEFQKQFFPGFVSEKNTIGSTGILALYLAGQRLEEAGDLAAAATNYRTVVSSPAKFAPVAEAQAGLQRIEKADPALLNDDLRQISETIRELSKRIDVLAKRQGGGR